MPKIIGGSLREHRNQTRDRLFAALAALMGERGFDSITLADIAARAGVGRTAVYNHFSDKDALLLGFIAHETERYARTLDAALAEVRDPVEQLRTYIRENAALRRSFHLAPAPDLRAVVRRPTQAQLGDHAQLIEAILRRILEAGIASGAFAPQDVDATVTLINACLRGHVIAGMGPPPDDAAVRAAEAFVLRAVGAPVAS